MQSLEEIAENNPDAFLPGRYAAYDREFRFPCMACGQNVQNTTIAMSAHRKAHENQAESSLEEVGRMQGTIASTAVDLVYGDREADYGHPDADFRATGRIMASIIERWMGRNDPDFRLPDIPPEIVALLIGSVKTSREAGKHKDDNLVDLIGYSLCAQRIIDRDWEEPKSITLRQALDEMYPPEEEEEPDEPEYGY